MRQEPGERSVSEDINKIAVLNDNALWTASESSSIRRWKVPLRRVIRAKVKCGRYDREDRITYCWVTVQIMVFLVSVSPPTASNHPESILTVNSSLDKAIENFRCGFKNLVKSTSPDDPLTEPHASSLYSAASIMSHRQRL